MHFKLPVSSKITTKFQQNFHCCRKPVCGECGVGRFGDYEMEERGLKDLGKTKTKPPSKRESTTVCAKQTGLSSL